MVTSALKSKMLKTVVIALFLFLAFHQLSYGADHIIPDQDLRMEEYFWTYGCTPTAAAMVLSYWDNDWYGRLIDYYYDNWCGNDSWVTTNVPNTIDELRSSMGTNWNTSTCTGDGGTSPFAIDNGLRDVTNSKNGYCFSNSPNNCWDCNDDWNPLCWGFDSCWNYMKMEINAGRPFVWNTNPSILDFVGHSVAAWGYRDDKYIILYDTWSPAGREDWYYNHYLNNPNDHIYWVSVRGLTPGCGDYGSAITLDDPNGGETLLANHTYTIQWYQWGTTIDNVAIVYSTDGGVSWNGVDSWVDSVEGWNSYTWPVPNIASTSARVRMMAYAGADRYIAGDGSFGNFTINMPTCSTLNYPTNEWQRVWYIKSTGACLGNGPDESNIQFDNNWGEGIVAYGRNDDIAFSSSRSILFSDGVYRFEVGADDGLRIWIDGVLQWDKWVDQLYYGRESFYVPLSTGYHNVRLDYYKVAHWAALGEVSFAFWPLPDLIVQSLSISPTSPMINQDVSVTVTVKNQGAGLAYPFYVDIYKNRDTPPPVGLVGDARCYTGPLAAGATTTCVQTVSYASAGTYKMWAQVDTENQRQEAFEYNNLFVIIINVLTTIHKRDEIIGTWSTGIWYWNPATSGWTKMFSSVPSGPIAAGDVTGDGRADVASVWPSGLWYQNGATLGWTKVYSVAPSQVAVGDITGDGRAEIIGTWSTGIWYWNPATSGWTKMFSSVPSGPIAAGDVTGDGRADVVSCWPSGLWYQNGATLGWTKVYSVAPSQVAVGDITGDGRAEIIGTWSTGIWYWNPATSGWTKMVSSVPSGPIAAGDVTGDGKADVVSVWPSGLWYQDGATLGWTKVYSIAPSKIAVGDITGD